MATHFTGPVLNATHRKDSREWYSGLPVGLDPSFSTYFNDFLVAQNYSAGDWVVTVTQAGSGNAAEAITADERCGALTITNDNADNDLVAIQSAEEFIKLSAGKQVWFETKLKLNEVGQQDMFVGMAITDTTALATSSDCGFLLTDGASTLDCKTTLASTTTTTSAVATLVADTYVTLSFYWDGVNKVRFFVNRALVASHTTNIPTAAGALTLHVQNGEAVISTAIVDYFFVCQER